MPNPFDRAQNFKMYHGSSQNFRGTLSDVATDITIVHDGYYKISASIDWHGRGPTSSTAAASAAASTAGSQPWFAKEWQIVHLEAGDHVSQIMASSAVSAGVYYVSLLEAGPRA